jgi:hypothetical protein
MKPSFSVDGCVGANDRKLETSLHSFGRKLETSLHSFGRKLETSLHSFGRKLETSLHSFSFAHGGLSVRINSHLQGDIG